jgi:hypothetical protein
MAFIAQAILESRIENLTRKRDDAIRRKDYDRATILNLKIDKNVNRMFSFNC